MASRWLQLQAAQHFAWQTKMKAAPGAPGGNETGEDRLRSIVEEVESAIKECNTHFKKSSIDSKPEVFPADTSEQSSPPPANITSSPQLSSAALLSTGPKVHFPSNAEQLSLFLKDNPFLHRSNDELVSPTSSNSLPSPRIPGWPVPIIPPAANPTPPPPLNSIPKSLLFGRGPFNNEIKQRLADGFPHLIRPPFDKQSLPRMNFNSMDPRLIATRVSGFPHPLGSPFQIPPGIPNGIIDSLSKSDVQHLASTNRGLSEQSLPMSKTLPMSASSRSSSVSTPSSIDISSPAKPNVPQDVFRCIWCQEQYHSLASLTEHLKEAKHSSPIPPTSQLPNSAAKSSFAAFSSKRFEHLNHPFKNALAAPKKQRLGTKGLNFSTGEKTGQSNTPSPQQSHPKQPQKGDPLPRKLVRGQDVWLGKGQEQTRQILKCMWCGSSFKTLAELTQHMQETQHYTKVISQEQITSWRSQAAAEGKPSVSPLLASPASSSDSPSCLSSNLSSIRSGGGIFDSALTEKGDIDAVAPSNNNIILKEDSKDCISAILTCKVCLWICRIATTNFPPTPLSINNFLNYFLIGLPSIF